MKRYCLLLNLLLLLLLAGCNSNNVQTDNKYKNIEILRKIKQKEMENMRLK